MPTKEDILTYENQRPLDVETLTILKEIQITPEADNSCLPSLEDFNKLDQSFVESYYKSKETRLSEPKYVCPRCGGGMCKDMTQLLMCDPPMYRYECNACEHVSYHHI